MGLKSARPPVVERITDRVGRLLAPVPLTPNGWTILSLLPALAGLIALLDGRLLIGLVLFSLAATMDVIDGAVARARAETTAFGAYLDGMVDRFVEATALFGLMVFGYPDWILPGWLWLALLLFFGTAMTSYARAYADHKRVVTDETGLDALGGVLERAERVLLVLLSMCLWLVDPRYATYVIAFATALAVVTVGQRVVHVRQQVLAVDRRR